MANGIDFGTAVGLIKGLGSPDPAVIESAVNGWLDDHPEATTTVQDGSITKAKLDSNLQGTVDDVADLKSAVEEISQSGIDASGASDGQVPVADGEGSWEWDDPAGGVSDVQVNGTSVVNQGVANVPLASPTVPGVVVAGTITVTGTTPSITALPGIRYMCGEVATLDITLPASGIVDVVFESGSTATVLTITPPTGMTLKWANGFDPTALDANTVYEINIADGLGVAASWT